MLEHSFYSLNHISANLGANYDKRIVAKLYSKIIDIVLIFRSAMAVVWDPVLLCFVFFIVSLGQKLRGCLKSLLATDEVTLSILVLPAQWYSICLSFAVFLVMWKRFWWVDRCPGAVPGASSEFSGGSRDCSSAFSLTTVTIGPI